MDSWTDLSASLQARTATVLLSTVETSGFLLADNNWTNESTTLIQYPNILLRVDSIDISKKSASTFDVSLAQKIPRAEDVNAKEPMISHVKLSREVVEDNADNGVTKVVFSVYTNIQRWMTAAAAATQTTGNPQNCVTDPSNTDRSLDDAPCRMNVDNETDVNTVIMSVSVRNRDRVELRKPFEFTLEHFVKENMSSPSCVYWSFSPDSHDDGHWASDGCQLVHSNSSHTTCECDHLTNFAVLMATTDHQLSDGHKFALALITYFGCIFSIICLLLSFITFQCFKNLQCDRNTIHKNLVLSLFIAEVVFMIGIVQYEHKILCSVIAMILHYLFLVSFAWMCLEGVQLYVLLIEVFEAEKSRLNWYYVGAYGIPAVIVITSAAVDFAGYGTEEHCWLTVDRGFIWAFVGPVVVILAINLAMLSIAMHTMCKHASNAVSWRMKHSTKLETIGSWLKGAFVLVVLLGSTWIFGLFYVNQQSVFMAYVFTLCNSLQGVFIFLFHCYLSDKVQKEYRRFIRKATWLPESFRAKYGDGVGASSVQNHTSSSAGGNYLFKLLRNRSQRSSSGASQKRKSQCHSKEGVQILITPPDGAVSPSRARRCPSSGSDTARLTDSSNLHSDQYLGENTEDPSGYMDPALTCVDEREFNLNFDFDLSTMENSVMDMDCSQRANGTKYSNKACEMSPQPNGNTKS